MSTSSTLPTNKRQRVLVFGTFDGLHPGHQFFLNEAAARGELWVVVARDANVLRIKGRTSAQSETERQRLVEEAFPESRVVLGDPADFLIPVREIAPDLILLGYDQQLPPGVQPGDLPCPVERIAPFNPEKYKSSLLRKS